MTAGLQASVVIPTYKRGASIERLLQALARQTCPPSRYEVVISIDGSDDGTAEAVQCFQAPYLLRSMRNAHRGRGAACNSGIRVAAGEIAILLDDDMEPAERFVEAHLEAHAEYDRLGVVGAVPITVGADSPPLVRYMAGRFDRHLRKLSDPGERIAVRDFYSGNFSIRRDLFLEVGGFDEAFTDYGNEDLELWIRLTQASVSVVYDPAALAWQHYTKDVASLCRDTMAKGRSALLLAAKHPAYVQGLKLATYRGASPRWFRLRSVLLWMSGTSDLLPRILVAVLERLDRHRAPGLERCYDLALDYFFWLGVKTALPPGRDLSDPVDQCRHETPDSAHGSPGRSLLR